MTIKEEAILLIVRSVNALLTAEGKPFRVTADDLVTTTANGHMLLALTTTVDAVDYRNAAPYSTMQ